MTQFDDNFLNVKIGSFAKHGSDMDLLKSYFQVQEVKGSDPEACDKLQKGPFKLGVHQLSAFVMARRLAQNVHSLPDDMPSGALMFHSTGSGKTVVAALIFMAFYDVMWLFRNRGKKVDKEPQYLRTHISHHGRVGLETFEFRDQPGGSFKAKQMHRFPGGYALPGSHRRVIYVTTKEGLANNPNFPEKELKATVMPDMDERQIHDLIIQSRGERFERITFDMLAAILFGSADRKKAKSQRDQWFKSKKIEITNISTQGDTKLVYNPYYLANATVIFDEAQNLFKPKTNQKRDVLRYKMLRQLLTDPRERQAKNDAVLFEDDHSPPRRTLIPHGRTHMTCVYVLSATPGESKKELLEIMNMMNTPRQYRRGATVTLDECSTRVSYVNRTQDTTLFPVTGKDFLHEVPLSKSTQDKISELPACKHQDSQPKGNMDVKDAMIAEYGKYFEHPAVLEVNKESGLLQPVQAKTKNGYKANPHYKLAPKLVPVWREEDTFTVMANECDIDTLTAHGSTSMYSQEERKHAAKTQSKLTRLRNVILRTPREKHYVYFGIGVKEVVPNYSMHQVASLVLDGQPTLALVAKNTKDPEATLRKHLTNNASPTTNGDLKPSTAEMLKRIKRVNPGFIPRKKKRKMDPEHIAEEYSKYPNLAPSVIDVSRLGQFMTDQDVMLSFPRDAERQNVLEQVADTYRELDPAKLSKKDGKFYLGNSVIKKVPRYGILCTLPKSRCQNQAGMSLLVDLYNDKQNKHGEYLQVLFAAQRYNEGLDLAGAINVHILTPHASAVDRRQTIGRSARFCSMKQLPVQHRRTHVHNYIAVRRDGGATVDHEIVKLAEDTDRLGKLEVKLARMALDCNALKELHGIECLKDNVQTDEKGSTGLYYLLEELRRHWRYIMHTSEQFDKMEAFIQASLPTVNVSKKNKGPGILFHRIIDS